MGTIRATFERLRRARRKALIPFIIGGDPSLAATGPLLLALQEAGADVIEVGIPFSDPLADGPVIQAGVARALARGATPARVLDAVAAVRPRLRVPVVALTYWNPVAQFSGGTPATGVRAFVRRAGACGVSGVIVPDLPVEEGRLLCEAAPPDFATIFLAAPTSPPARLRLIARASTGFIYYVSVTGTTGVQQALPPALVEGVRQLRLLTTKPICVGFGISTPAQAAGVARVADGVIVGSALVRELAGARSRKDLLRRAGALVRRLRRAVG
jgi:tryptophan synthase alpha chain